MQCEQALIRKTRAYHRKIKMPRNAARNRNCLGGKHVEAICMENMQTCFHQLGIASERKRGSRCHLFRMRVRSRRTWAPVGPHWPPMGPNWAQLGPIGPSCAPTSPPGNHPPDQGHIVIVAFIFSFPYHVRFRIGVRHNNFSKIKLVFWVSLSKG